MNNFFIKLREKPLFSVEQLNMNSLGYCKITSVINFFDLCFQQAVFLSFSIVKKLCVFSKNQLQAHKLKIKHKMKYIAKDVLKTRKTQFGVLEELLVRRKTLKSVWDLQWF